MTNSITIAVARCYPGVLLTMLLLFACDEGSNSGADTHASDASVSPSDTANVVRMCLLNNACGYQSLLSVPADTCVERVLGARMTQVLFDEPATVLRHARMLECAGSAASCDDYISCVNFDATCSYTVKGSCQGTVRDACSTPGGGPPIIDCALMGMTCDDTDGAMCVVPASAADCEAGTQRCEGNQRVYCSRRADGRFGEFHAGCPDGLSCLSNGSDVYCGKPIEPCAAQAGTCEGDVAVLCGPWAGDDKNVEMRMDCGAVGRACERIEAEEGTWAECVDTGTECTTRGSGEGTSARCDGDAIEVCIEGRLERITCPSVGRTHGCVILPALPGGIQPATPVCADGS